MQNIAIYPGSFDPITSGHLSIIKRALKVFDTIIVGVSVNEAKNPLFSMEERLEFVQKAVPHHVIVKPFEGLLVDFCKQEGVTILIRGLRAVSDFDYEFQLALVNRRMNRQVETMFLMTDYQYSYLSSSLVKNMAQYGGNIDGLVPEHVKEALEEKRALQRA